MSALVLTYCPWHKVKANKTEAKAHHININNKAASYATAVAPYQDFPIISQNSNTPTKTTSDSPTIAETMMIETMNMLKEQNKTMMEMMLNMMQQNQQAPLVPQSQ